MKRVLILFLIIIPLANFGQKQKKALVDSKEEIITTATEELDRAMEPPDGSIYLFKTEHKITGLYTFDISIHEKGEVASVFCKEREGGSIPMQNKLKDFIKEFSFSFKMPKGKKYKFNYVFDFK